MSKRIGQSVLNITPKVKMTMFVKDPNHVKSVTNALEKAEKPLTVTEVQRRSGMKSWYVVKNVLTALIVKGRVECLKTGAYKVYRLKRIVS